MEIKNLKLNWNLKKIKQKMKEEERRVEILKENFKSLRNEINSHMNWVSITFLMMLYASVFLLCAGSIFSNSFLFLLPILIVSASLLWIKEQMDSVMAKASFIRTNFLSEGWENYLYSVRVHRSLRKRNPWKNASGDSKVISIIGMVIILLSVCGFALTLDYSFLKMILLMLLSSISSYLVLIKNVLQGYSIREKRE